ncbi:ABC transporter permease [Pyramidobacter sp. C12-8]|uniref:ABC transporter permease n=1 Tax=Pyramidobacter sp. C12-8 TaxID=1943580 RepID=UPI00098FDE0D|nr:ABC transporter permease [Pyramidobacter sp. C12-8]OON87316.1 peptide ABC transporter permease [Pyramidobacter sp. C12-8]
MFWSGRRISFRGGDAILAEARRRERERLFANTALLAGICGCAAVLLTAFLVPELCALDPNVMAVTERLQPPSVRHLFGTDRFGRDLFIRVVYGARVSLSVGAWVAFFSGLCGAALGLCASYFRALDGVLMRLCDGLTAIPGVLLAIALMAALGTGSWNVALALTAVYTPGVARVVRSRALVVKQQLYVEAAKVQGAGSAAILWRLILPGVVSPLAVQLSFIFAQAIIDEASLSFLGAGIPAPAASWGNILQESRQVLQRAPWTIVFPSAAAVFCVLSLNLLGDGLRDYLDPLTESRVRKK